MNRDTEAQDSSRECAVDMRRRGVEIGAGGIGVLRRTRRTSRWPVTIPLLAVIGLPAAAPAGTGRLVSHWMSRAPTIDGQIAPAEWQEARLVDLGSGVTVWIGNDARTLYLAVLDAGNLTYDMSDRLFLAFDDEGGVAPVLDDSAFGNPICQGTPDLGEGVLTFFYDQNVRFIEFSLGAACPLEQFIADRTRFLSAARPEGAVLEMAIPLDGPAPLRAGPGERFGVRLIYQRDLATVACLPGCAGTTPPDFRNLVLASGGCNTGPQDFGSGNPQLGLPLNWTSEITFGSGPGWVQSLPPSYGDPVFCQSNDTGGAGGAACVANYFSTSANTVSLLRMPLTLAGQTSATVRSRAVLVVDPNGYGANDVLRSDVLRQDATTENAFFWQGQDQSATVVLPLTMGGSPPVELWFIHSTFAAGGIEGGFAQVDEVELFCGPVLFADGFESGLTTHWSATAP